MVILDTERRVLRHLQPTDLDALVAFCRGPQSREYFPDGTRTRAETAEDISFLRNGHPPCPALRCWATVDSSIGAFLGRCGLRPWQIDGSDGRHGVELAFLIDKTRWREGLPTEAADAGPSGAACGVLA